VQRWINLRAGHRTKVTALKLLQKLNRQAARSILQQDRIVRITSRTCSDNFGLSGFSGGANIVVVPQIFPAGLQTQAGLGPKFGYFS